MAGALRLEIVPLESFGGVAGLLRSFRVLVDCWQWELRFGGRTDFLLNWRLNGVNLRDMVELNAINEPTASALKFGGFTHQLGGQKGASPGNFNTTLFFQPVDPTAGSTIVATLFKVYYDPGLIDPDFPG